MPSRFFPGSRIVIRTLTISIVALAVLVTPSANADWRVAPSIVAGLEYDDNPSLNTDSIAVPSVWGYALGADARMSYNTQLTNFTLTPRYLGSRYDDFSELDSDDWFLDLDYVFTGQLSSFRFRGTYADESIRRAERSDVDFDVEDPTEIPDDQSGRVLGTENRQRIHIAPDWSYQTSQRSLVRMGASYLDVAYNEISTTLLSDYTDARGLASLEFSGSPTNTIIIHGYYRENEFERNSNTFSGYGLTLGFARSITENARFVINAGMDSTEDEFGIDHTNPIGEISFVRNLQTSKILAAYRRTVSGSGSNVLSVRDSISLNFSRDVSQRFAVSAGILAYQTRGLDKNATSFDDRNYLQFRTVLTYNLSPVFSIDVDYRYTDLDRDITASTASSNLVNLWFRYRSQN